MKRRGMTDACSAVSAPKKKCVRQKQLLPGSFFIYILEMENGSLYTGYTSDLASRYRTHCSGRGAKYTRAFKPVRIAACWQTAVKSDAMKAEAFIKSLDRKEKIFLLMKPRLLNKMLLEKKGYNFDSNSLNQRTIKKLSG